MDASALNSVINRLLEAREKPGKLVQLSETEIKQLCFVSRDIFLRQPNLLELEAPVKICGNLLSVSLYLFSQIVFLWNLLVKQGTFMDNTQIF